jgi:hypothetical protein
MSFYTTHIDASSEERRKLSCHVVSHAPDGAGTVSPAADGADTESPTTEGDSPASSNEENPPVAVETQSIINISSFKMGQPLFPLAKPYTKLENFKRNFVDE